MIVCAVTAGLIASRLLFPGAHEDLTGIMRSSRHGFEPAGLIYTGFTYLAGFGLGPAAASEPGAIAANVEAPAAAATVLLKARRVMVCPRCSLFTLLFLLT